MDDSLLQALSPVFGVMIDQIELDPRNHGDPVFAAPSCETPVRAFVEPETSDSGEELEFSSLSGDEGTNDDDQKRQEFSQPAKERRPHYPCFVEMLSADVIRPSPEEPVILSTTARMAQTSPTWIPPFGAGLEGDRASAQARSWARRLQRIFAIPTRLETIHALLSVRYQSPEVVELPEEEVVVDPMAAFHFPRDYIRGNPLYGGGETDDSDSDSGGGVDDEEEEEEVEKTSFWRKFFLSSCCRVRNYRTTSTRRRQQEKTKTNKKRSFFRLFRRKNKVSPVSFSDN